MAAKDGIQSPWEIWQVTDGGTRRYICAKNAAGLRGTLTQSPLAGVRVESTFPHKSGERHSESQRDLDRKAGRRTYSDDHCDPRHQRFLHQLEAHASAGQQNLIVQRKRAFQKCRAD